jgi:UDP-N-acetylbacillosamine N-acetyltransferase
VKQRLVIWGAGGHALVVADIIRLQGEYKMVGFLDDVNPERGGTEFCGIPILGGREQLSNLRRMSVQHLLLGFGDCDARLRLSTLIRARGFTLASAIHPRAIVAIDVPIGPGTVIAAGAVINPGGRVGENVIINTCASIDHECIVEDGAHVAPGAHLGGRVRVGRAAWVGIGATIKERVSIGECSLIGAGAVVLSDIPDGVVACGVPAKVIREVVSNDK